METPPTFRAWITRSFLVVAGVLIIAEGSARIFFGRSFEGRFDYGYHPNAGFDDSTRGSVRLFRAGGRRFHPQTYAADPAPGVSRILVAGDSVPRGPSLAASYAKQLEDMLNSAGAPAEVWNLAVPGYGARRIQITALRALRYKPSLLVLHLNDSNEFEDEREYRRSQDNKGWHPRTWLMKSLVFRRLHEAKTERIFWEWLPEKVREKSGLSDVDAEVAASAKGETLDRWNARVHEITRETIAKAMAQGTSVLLITQRSVVKDSSGQLSFVESRLEEFAASQTNRHVGMLSMRSVLQAENLSEMFADGSHLRAAGHTRIAQAIRQKLIELEPRSAVR
ncbi:MAG: hypothetical protein FJ405_01260 [Verrucomicrobia bacterium]|nr:hypothetical protein [Verrucomicrobiota bacterium]